MKYLIRCSQRGCASEAEGDATPVTCPVCNNPLLDGDVTPVAVTPPPPPPPPVETPPPPPPPVETPPPPPPPVETPTNPEPPVE